MTVTPYTGWMINHLFQTSGCEACNQLVGLAFSGLLLHRIIIVSVDLSIVLSSFFIEFENPILIDLV